jgi:galactose oxidase
MRLCGAVFLCAVLLGATGARADSVAIVSASSAQCASVATTGTAKGSAVVQAICNGNAAQVWSVVPYNGHYHVVSGASGLCLNVNGASNKTGAPIIEYPCQMIATHTNDQWSLVSAGEYTQIVSVHSGKCLVVNGNSLLPGASLIQSPCGPDLPAYYDALWSFAAPATAALPATDIVSASSGQCATVNGGSTAPLTPVVQTPCAGASDQSWTLQPVGNYFHVISTASGLCLNVQGNSQAAGTPIVQLACQGAGQTNDQWSLVSVGEYDELVAVGSGQCLNVDGASQSSGAALIQWPCQGAQPADYNDLWSLAAPAAPVLRSAWTPVIPLPVTPIAVANLPDGTLLLWSAYAPMSFEGDIGTGGGQTYTGIFNPATLTSTEVLVTNTGADMFCPGTAVLPNGQVLVNGGSSSPKTSLYSPLTGTWTSGAEMNIPRGYEADVPLSNGNVLTLGGSWSGGQGGKTGEVWNGSGWTVAPGIPEDGVVGPDPQGIYRGDNHLWLFAQGNGSVFHAGPSAQMNWITTGGSGAIQSAGNRGSDPYSINGNAVLFDIGRILKVGGATAYQQPAGSTVFASSSAVLIDITAGVNQTPTVTQLAPMTYQRAFANSVVLPDGSVVVVGGQSIPEPFTDSAAILVPELWSPVTQQFSLLKPMQTPRTYHSTAILMADGRVFVGGGGQCGDGCLQNHLNAEILTPPYLLNADGSAATRPVITASTSSASPGGTLSVTTGGPVSAFALMRLSATTHTVNNDQRRVPLTIQSGAGTTSYLLNLPSDPGVILPGYYMLFALDAHGVPSLSASVQVL